MELVCLSISKRGLWSFKGGKNQSEPIFKTKIIICWGKGKGSTDYIFKKEKGCK